MGSASKIILIGATSLIIGIYAVSLKIVQTEDIYTAMGEAKRLQFELVQAAAVRTAIDKFIAAPNYGTYAVGPLTRAQLGGDAMFTFTFSGVNPGHSSNLQLTVFQRNQIAVLQNNKVVMRDTLVPRIIYATVTNTSGSGVNQGPRKLHRSAWQATNIFVQREH